MKIVRAVNALPKVSAALSFDGGYAGKRSPSGDICGGTPGEHLTPANDPDALLRNEYQRGMSEGQRRSEDFLRSELAEKLQAEQQRVERLMSSATEQLSVLYRSSEDAIVKFAFGIAERVIRREVSLDRTMVLEQIKEGVRRVLGVETVKIRVHPGDLPLVREHKGVIQASGDSIREIIVEGDENLEAGDCIIESEMGNIDARIVTQLKQIENVLFESKVVT